MREILVRRYANKEIHGGKMIRIFRIVIFASGDDAPIKITGVENFLVQGSLSAKKLTELVLEGVRRRGIKITDSEFDVLSPTSNRWLDGNKDVTELPEGETTLILVAKAIKERFGDDESWYLALAELDAKLREKEEKDILVNISKSLEQLLGTLRKLDHDTIDRMNRIITLNPNFMGIGVNLNELFVWLKKILKKE